MTINKQVRDEWRDSSFRDCGEEAPSIHCIVNRLLDALEQTEAERDLLADKLADTCYLLYPRDEKDRWWFQGSWLEWAQQKATKYIAEGE